MASLESLQPTQVTWSFIPKKMKISTEYEIYIKGKTLNLILMIHFFIWIVNGCGCKSVDGGGCIIDPTYPPPPGFKCECYESKIGDMTIPCNERATYCVGSNNDGCSGCSEKECCLGDCDGYNVKMKRETK